LSAIAVAGKGQMRGLAYGAKVFKEMNKAKETARPGRPGLLASAARLLSIAGCLTFSSVGHAADWNFAPPPPAAADYSENSGVPCSAGAPFWAPLVATAAVLPWPSVWLGHFSGGRPYVGGNGQTLVDWQDAKVCFPSRHQCQPGSATCAGLIIGRKGIGRVCSCARACSEKVADFLDKIMRVD
jgi:hypothetical protein